MNAQERLRSTIPVENRGREQWIIDGYTSHRFNDRQSPLRIGDENSSEVENEESEEDKIDNPR